VGYEGVKRLAKERPDWLSIVKACYEIAGEIESGEFAGSWVNDKLGGGWNFPSLRLLVRYEILKHEYSTRQKARAYYTMPDREGVGRALRELGTS